MHILHIAAKDLRQIARDRMAGIFLLGMPIVFTLMFGFIFAGAGGEEEDARLPLLYLDKDDSRLSGQLITLLQESEVVRLVAAGEQGVVDEAGVESVVAEETVAAALIVPEGYGDALLAGESLTAESLPANTPSLTLVADPGNSGAVAVSEVVEGAAVRLAQAVQAARLSSGLYEVRRDFASEEARLAYFDEALTRALDAWQEPPLTITERQTGVAPEDSTAEVYGENRYAHSSPGMIAQFTIAGLFSAAGVLVLERKNRSLRRLLTTAVSRLEILIGHFLAMFIMILVQVLLLALFGQLVLGLPYFSAPLATVLLAMASAVFAAGLGLLIGALAQTEDQVVIYALIPMFVLSALGGAWMPLEFTPETFQRIAYFTPAAWIVDGFKDILIRGQGLEAVLPAVGVLLAYGALLFLLAAWRFRYE